MQVRFLPEESSRVVALRSGEVDVIDSISPTRSSSSADCPASPRDPAGHRLTHIFYNFRKPKDHPLSDPRSARPSATPSTARR